LLGEPSFEKRAIIQTMQHPKGKLRMPTFPVRFDGGPPPVKPAPLLGEHTAKVFGEWLGMSASDVERLRNEGVV
jgi:crotonobetainyl-CoA:carnitine CoA-transferase CaiB-like acyl-CoA transferase